LRSNSKSKYIQNQKVINKKIEKVDLSKSPFLITDHRGETYLTKTIIIATGSKPLTLGLENEDNLWSKGISSCAVCDGALYKNKEIVVVGKILN
jgi:thioredoxin reductase (NADPH)